jgi:hypothetical protein
MQNDLEVSLIDGGLPAAAAKILSNAIGNAATGRMSRGRATEDSTPSNTMRLVGRDDRRYMLSNLDHPAEDKFKYRLDNAGNQYTPRDLVHPYEGSQPSSAKPTISTPSVKSGGFIASEIATTNDVAQSKVSLDTEDKGGQHARVNRATGRVETVPISVECYPERLIDAEVVEEAGKTVIRIRLKNLNKAGLITGFPTTHVRYPHSVSNDYYIKGISTQ